MRWRSGNSNRFRRPETMQGQQICSRTGLPQLPLFQAGQCIHVVQPALLRPGYRRNSAIHVASLCNLEGASEGIHA